MNADGLRVAGDCGGFAWLPVKCFPHSPIHPLDSPLRDVSLRFMPFDDSPRPLGPAKSSIFILALETASPRCPLGRPAAQRHRPCFGSLHPAEETQVKSPGSKKTLKGVPWPPHPRRLDRSVEPRRQRQRPEKPPHRPPCRWGVVRRERLGEPCSGGPCPWPLSQGCPRLVPRSRPARVSIRPSLLPGPVQAALTWRAPGKLWEKRPGHPLTGWLNPFRFV